MTLGTNSAQAPVIKPSTSVKKPSASLKTPNSGQVIKYRRRFSNGFKLKVFAQ